MRAASCVLACWNMMIPYLCPDLPERQRAALHELVKTPLVYTSVAIRNWRAFAALGIARVYAQAATIVHSASTRRSILAPIAAQRSPDEPMLVHMTRTPCRPGLRSACPEPTGSGRSVVDQLRNV